MRTASRRRRQTVKMEAFILPRNKTRRYQREAEIWRHRYWELRSNLLLCL